MSDLYAVDLHPALSDPAMRSMNLLNEIAGQYPDAISFAAGRPYEGFYEVDAIHRYLRLFCAHLVDRHGYDEQQVRRALFQYGRTKGIVHDLVARNLTVDEGIHVDAESIVLTTGCQEAMYLVLRALRSTDRDAVLAVQPTYVGLTGAARLVDMPVVPVPEGPEGITPDGLTAAVRQAEDAGLRPRACYVIPDFANPSGVSLDVDSRRRLLDVAKEHRLLLLEDNPYGLFHADGERLPTLKSLDRNRQVVYLGSYAKSGLPGVRIGFAVADQWVDDGQGGQTLFADELSKIKSMLTVNTSPIAQAVIGGRLLEHDCSLLKANHAEIRHYRHNLHRLLTGLAARFPSNGTISWNTPRGGFFVVLTVPFPASDELLAYSAEQHGVLWTPMHHFYGGHKPLNQLRLSHSLLTPEHIELGLDRLAALFTDL